MRVYLLSKDFSGTNRHTITGKDMQYLVNVLRLRQGFQFIGRDSKGQMWSLTMESIEKHACTLICAPAGDEQIVGGESLPEYRGPFPQIYLYQAVCKGKKMDQIVRQATELGVSRIIPVTSEHTVVDVSQRSEGKVSRYETIVKEALQQSGSPLITQIDPFLSLKEVGDHWNRRGPAYVLHQSAFGTQKSFIELLSRHTDIAEIPMAMLIGAEGGFSDREIEIVTQQGFEPVLLKTNILRAETAAIAAVAIAQQILVDAL